MLEKTNFHQPGICASQEIHGLLRQGVSADNISAQLTPWASALFEFLPPFIRKQVHLNVFHRVNHASYIICFHYFADPEVNILS